MCSTRSAILELLSDRRPHSGAEIAKLVGIGPSTVHYHMRKLTRLGLGIQRIDRQHYCLRTPLRPLRRRTILEQLGAEASFVTDRFCVRQEVDSTSLSLLRQRPWMPGSVCVAEMQTAGRGRHGRGWVATPYCNILLSMSWRLRCAPAVTSGLSLAAGIAVVRALADHGVNAGLKWPNDVVWHGRKLAGVLIDTRHDARGSVFVVVGVGVNAYIARRDADAISQPWVDLTTITGTEVDRNRLVAQLIGRLRATLHTFQQAGFSRFRQEWERLHVFNGRQVSIVDGDAVMTGRVLGIDALGALRLQDDNGRVKMFHCGHVRARPVA